VVTRWNEAPRHRRNLSGEHGATGFGEILATDVVNPVSPTVSDFEQQLPLFEWE
jgi:hypothetical protein